MKIKSHPYLLLLLLAIAIGNSACNPECQLVAGLRTEPSMVRGGDQLVVKANPLSSLQDKKVFINNNEVNASFNGEVGLIVTVPQGLSGLVELQIADIDCRQGTAFEVVENSFFANNPSFIPPSPPEIIIPVTPDPPLPPIIDNAWLSPDDMRYCLWFTMIKTEINGNTVTTNAIDQFNSIEQSFKACEQDTTVFFYENPIFGTVDKENNVIHFWIDRTGIGLGLEEMYGQFVAIDNLPARYAAWEPPCTGAIPLTSDSGYDKRCYAMLLTSRKTGRQTLVYQQGLDLSVLGFDTGDQPCP